MFSVWLQLVSILLLAHYQMSTKGSSHQSLYVVVKDGLLNAKYINRTQQTGSFSLPVC